MIDDLLDVTMQRELIEWLEPRPELNSWLNEHTKVVRWMNNNIEFIEWVQHYKDERVVIKYGGGLTAEEIAEEIIFMKLCEIHPNIIPGGGKYISTALKQAFPDYEPVFVNGDRVTDGYETSSVLLYEGKTQVEIAHQVLSKISDGIVKLLRKYIPEGIGVRAIGTSPKEALFLCTQKNEKTKFVGNIEKLKHKNLPTLYDEKIIPVYPPLGYGGGKDRDKVRLNLNGDTVASYLASFNYDKGESYIPRADLIFVTSSSNIYEIAGGNRGQPTEIPLDELTNVVQDWVDKGGSRTKIQACIDAVARGVERIHIVDGEQKLSPYTILDELFTEKGSGILITK